MTNLPVASSLRYSICFLLLLLLATGVAFGARWMVADIHHYAALDLQAQWNEKGAIGSLDEWNSAQAKLDSAIALDGNEPLYHQLMALNHEWRGFAITGSEISVTELLASRREAVAGYRESALLRPAQPSGWLHLARMKVMAVEADDEFKTALHNALILGVHDANSLAELAFTVSLSWRVIDTDPALKALVIATLTKGLQNGVAANRIVNALDNSELMGEFCLGLDLESLADEVLLACQGAG